LKKQRLEVPAKSLYNTYIESRKRNNMKHAVCVVVPHPFYDGLFLSVSRRGQPDQWGFPGGKVDPGETCEEAAIRETLEETGFNTRTLVPIFAASVYGTDSQDFHVTTFTVAEYTKVTKGEADLTVEWQPEATLCNPLTSPFSEYNKGVFAALKHQD
jgi:8-oxo-dGTP pyrophosphatase MutT (NUDIX family)